MFGFNKRLLPLPKAKHAEESDLVEKSPQFWGKGHGGYWKALQGTWKDIFFICNDCLVNNNNSNNDNDNNNINNDNNNDDDDDNNGNFICVFECTIVNLATYRQFTNAAWDWIIKKTKQNKTKAKKKERKKTKVIKIALRLSYPNFYFYNKRCNMFL